MESASPELTLPQQLREPDPRGPMVGWLRLEEAQRDQKCKYGRRAAAYRCFRDCSETHSAW